MNYFIINPHSGKGNGEEVAKKIKEYLKKKKADFCVYLTTKDVGAEELAKKACEQQDCTAVIAVGGDGTFSEVLNGMDISKNFGVIPAGSGNDFLRSAGEMSLEERLDKILSEKTKYVDFISANDRRCLNVLGCGFDVDILLREARYRKVLSGSLSYLASLLVGLLSLKFNKIKMTIDGTEREEEVLIMALANGRCYGGGLTVSPESEIDDGLLQAVFIKKLPFYAIPGTLIKFLSGKINEERKYTEIISCKEFDCVLAGNGDMQIDGEILQMKEIHCKVHSNELKMFL